MPLGASVALYREIAPQTDTRPNVFILKSTTSKNSPPTCDHFTRIIEKRIHNAAQNVAKKKVCIIKTVLKSLVLQFYVEILCRKPYRNN